MEPRKESAPKKKGVETEWATIADYIAYKKRRARKKWLIIIAIVLLLVSVYYCLYNDMQFRCKLVLSLCRSNLETISEYLISRDDLDYLNHKTHSADDYENYEIPETETKAFQKYFKFVKDGEIIFLGHESDRWSLSTFPKGANAVNFYVCSEDDGDALNYRGIDYTNYYLCYTDQSMDSLLECLESDDYTKYEITELQDNWYMIARISFHKADDGANNSNRGEYVTTSTAIDHDQMIERLTNEPAYDPTSEYF